MGEVIEGVAQERALNVDEAVNAVMGDLKAIGKNSQNQQQRFQYRSIDDILNAVKPLLSKYGLFFYPSNILSRELSQRTTKNGTVQYSVNLIVEYTIKSKDGSSFTAAVPAEGLDMGDKATTKAMTFAEKTLLAQLFCISTEDMVDPDQFTPEETVAPQQGGKPNWALQLDDAARNGGAEAVEGLLYQWQPNVPANEWETVERYGNKLIAAVRK